MSELINNEFQNTNPETDLFIENNLKITELIYSVLEEKSWSKKDLAQKMEINYSRLVTMLNGMYNFTLKDITKFEHVLDINII